MHGRTSPARCGGCTIDDMRLIRFESDIRPDCNTVCLPLDCDGFKEDARDLMEDINDA